MSVIIRGDPAPASTVTVRNDGYAYVQIKKNWADEWQADYAIEPIGAEVHVFSQGGWRIELLRKYGPACKGVHETAFAPRLPLNLDRWWVRIMVLGAEGETRLLTGRIYVDPRELEGTRAAGPQGTQHFVAYGPERQLEMTDLYESFWYGSGGTPDRLEWFPSFNIRGELEHLAGNRSTAKGTSGSYLFYAGSDAPEWTHYDILEYLIANFLNKSGQPQWSIGGQIELLQQLSNRFEAGTSLNAWDLVKKLAPRAAGMDMLVAETDAGFEFRPFTLSGAGYSFGGYDWPANPDKFRLDPNAKDRRVSLERASNERVDRIRIVGRRIVYCFTLPSPLSKKWKDAREAEYLAGSSAGGADASDHDAYRADDKFRDVFQAFGAHSSYIFSGVSLVKFALDGTIDSAEPNFQNTLRRTLNRLPLREGVNYTVDPPDESSVEASEADFLPPLVLVQDSTGRYIPVDQLNAVNADWPGVSVGVLQHDWGVRLRSAPNHWFARNHWSGAAESNLTPEADGFDWQTLVATIAIEGDQRLQIGVDLDSARSSGLETTKVIEVPEAQCWVLSRNTVIGVDESGALVRSPNGSGDNGVILRNDVDVLVRALAGAVARYHEDRIRLSVKDKGLQPAEGLLGAIVQSVLNGQSLLQELGSGDLSTIDTPVTGIRWDFKKRTTTWFAGHAER